MTSPLPHNPNTPPDICDVIFIPLTRGKFACIDVADYPLVAAYKWHTDVKPKSCYARSSGRHGELGKRPIRMHRIITGVPKYLHVDHWDNNGLNNRRRNLRICEQRQNNAHRHGVESASGFRGVRWDHIRQKYEARISKNNRGIRLGRFNDPIAAARAYDSAAKLQHGDFAVLNFPDAGTEVGRA